MSKTIITLNFINNDIEYKIIEKYLTLTNIFRVNLAKCNNYKEMVNIVERVEDIQASVQTPMRFIYDIPYPKKKIRFSLKSKKQSVLKDEIILITSADFAPLHDTKSLKVDTPIQNFRFGSGEMFIYDMGQLAFQYIEHVDENTIKVRATNNCYIYNTKSIIMGSPILNIKSMGDYIKLVNEHHIDAVMLSFVEHSDEIEKFKKYVSCSIISKIETRLSVDNIHSISQISDGLMISRGDLGIMDSIVRLPINQQIISGMAKLMKKELYIATDLMPSYSNYYLPIRNEIIDLYACIQFKPDYLIFTSGVIRPDCIEKYKDIIFNMQHLIDTSISNVNK